MTGCCQAVDYSVAYISYSTILAQVETVEGLRESTG